MTTPQNTAEAENRVLDASAAVEYLLGKPAGLLVGELMTGFRLLAPEMLDAEVLSVLRRDTLRGRIEEAAAIDALAMLPTLPVERVSHQNLIMAAWQLRHNLSGYDALYVAVAQIYDATVITADGGIAGAPASVLGVAVRNVNIV